MKIYFKKYKVLFLLIVNLTSRINNHINFTIVLQCPGLFDIATPKISNFSTPYPVFPTFFILTTATKTPFYNLYKILFWIFAINARSINQTVFTVEVTMLETLILYKKVIIKAWTRTFPFQLKKKSIKSMMRKSGPILNCKVNRTPWKYKTLSFRNLKWE